MEKFWLHGSLKNISFANLLFRVWRSKRSGSLEIKTKLCAENIDFFEGDIIVTKSTFPQDRFLIYLKTSGLINSEDVEKCSICAQEKSISQIKALIENKLIQASELWNHIQKFLRDRIQPIFDWDEGEFFFDSEKSHSERDIIISLSTLDLILEESRKMKNLKVINSQFPDDSSVLEILYPPYLNQLNLDLTELYLFQIIQDKKSLNEILEVSELGTEETKKRIYRLLALGVLGIPKNKSMLKSHQELTQADLLKIIKAFNEKCSYIFKYTSKEIGPVALNLLKKTIDDIRIQLPPQLRHIELDIDGNMKTDSILKINPIKAPDKDHKEILRGLNEILVAELFTVKKSLGNEHESILVKNLQKVGEWK